MRNFKITLRNSLFYFVLLFTCSASQADNINVKFLFVGEANEQTQMGIEQGLSEANLQGQFLGQTYEVINTSALDIDDVLSSEVITILVDADKTDIAAIAKQYSNIPIMNLRSDNDELRANCFENVFHIPPSAQMKVDALNQWKKKAPESNAIAQAWHPDFKKFAAKDLNKRFKKTHNTKMLDDAWAAWAAVKMISDAVARDNTVDSSKMLDFLKTSLAFDGQKGLNMSFRATGQLRQPVLIVEDDKILAEAPIRGVAKPPTVASLGLLDCPK